MKGTQHINKQKYLPFKNVELGNSLGHRTYISA